MVILAVFALNIAQPGMVLFHVGKFSFVLIVAGFACQNCTHEPSSEEKASSIREATLTQE
jgi:hypothetical protein